MKKTVVLIALLIFSLILIFGCSNNSKAEEIALDGYEEDSAVELLIGEFDYSEHSLAVTYSSGKTETIPLTEDMISEEDKIKFYREGEHEITVTHLGKTSTFKISVKRNAFGEISFPESNVFVYDGEQHVVEVSGEIPARAQITYPQGNTFVNAGEYELNAIITCDGYLTKKVSTIVKIEKADYDISNLRFDSKAVDYNGRNHTLTITGNLPEGVEDPIYYIGTSSSATVSDAGTYIIRAIFPDSDPNYNPIPEMTATLTIKKAKHKVDGLGLSFTNAKGKIIEASSKVFDGEAVGLKMENAGVLPAGTSVSYSAKRNGEELYSSAEPVSFADAGLYDITVSFKIPDNKNYEDIAPITASFEIEKANYDLGEVYLDSNSFVYNETPHKLLLNGELPEGVSVEYEYYKNGELIRDEEGKGVTEVSDAGEYTVIAKIIHNDENYNLIEPFKATLDIARKGIDVSVIKLPQDVEFVYDGTPKTIDISNIPEHVIVEKHIFRFDYNEDGSADISFPEEAIDCGEYIIVFMLSTENENYEILGEFYVEETMHILPQNINLAEIEYSGIPTSGTHAYDGNGVALTVSTLPAGLECKVSLYQIIDGNDVLIENATEAVMPGSYVFKTEILDPNGNFNITGETQKRFEFVIEKLKISALDISVKEGVKGTYIYVKGNNVEIELANALDEKLELIYRKENGEIASSCSEIGEYTVCIRVKSEYTSLYAISDVELNESGEYELFNFSITALKLKWSVEYEKKYTYNGQSFASQVYLVVDTFENSTNPADYGIIITYAISAQTGSSATYEPIEDIKEIGEYLIEYSIKYFDEDVSIPYEIEAPTERLIIYVNNPEQ